MEIQLKAATVLRRESLFNFLVGWMTRDRDDFGIPLHPKSSKSSDMMYAGMDRVWEFLIRLRQMRLDDEREELFHIPLSIDSVMQEAWGPGSAEFGRAR